MERGCDELDKSSRVPLYFQVMEKLIEEINTRYEDHDKLPSERELCKKYGVSRITVRQALQQLVQDRKSTRLNSSHVAISYAVFCLKKHTDGIQRQWGSAGAGETPHPDRVRALHQQLPPGSVCRVLARPRQRLPLPREVAATGLLNG